MSSVVQIIGTAGERLDVVLSGAEISRSRAAALIKDGCVKILVDSEIRAFNEPFGTTAGKESLMMIQVSDLD